MIQFRWLRYLPSFLLPASYFTGFLLGGWWNYLTVIYSFLLIPIIELIIPVDTGNLTQEEELQISHYKIFDWLLFAMLPLIGLALFIFLQKISDPATPAHEIVGLTLSIGILLGTLGINIGHELGHHKNRFHRLIAHCFLLSSLYMHFYIEHNRGHHQRVGTPDDPASARFGESIYAFWLRSIVGSYLSAWQLEKKRLEQYELKVISLKNRMVLYHVIQFTLLIVIALIFGISSMLLFCGAALMGILLLESVNYIEHYGLARQINERGTYNRTLHCHSWNSNHVMGRIMLFELTRHSDHHYKASKKYHLLNNHDDSPQMPTGYAGMIILALIPPLWFSVIHPIILKEVKRLSQIAIAYAP